MAGFMGDGLMPFMDVYSVMARMKEGDLIEFERGSHCHWGVCVGKDDIVHVTGSSEAAFASLTGSLGSSSSSGFDIFTDSEDVVVKHEKIKGVVKGGEARINNKTKRAREKGLCARRATDVVAACNWRVGDRSTYNLMSSNCEHFATEMKYGEAWSDQVTDKVFQVAVIGGGIALGVGIFMGLSALFSAPPKKESKKDDDDYYGYR